MRKAYNEIMAAFMFFTRLPLWRIVRVPDESFRHVVDYWPLVGIATGGASALALYVLSLYLPLSIAIILAIATRLLLTGVLHEDGFADFFDGFGGGTNRERILEIMKDSHIGTYGVVSLIVYFMLLYNSLYSMPTLVACYALLSADMWGKFCASFIVVFLSYARNEATSKAHVVYSPARWATKIIMFIVALVPTLILLPSEYVFALVASPFVCLLLFLFMKKQIGGYTGDCCGATFLMAELAYLIVAAALAY